MGAHNFATVATGRTMEAAYRSACEEATYEHGHDSYNGTISTTRGAILKTLPGKCTAAAIRRFEDEATERTEKWGACWAVELSLSMSKKRFPNLTRGHRAFLFVGWAAE